MLSLDIPIIILASPLVIIIRLLRPFLIIRIGKDDIGRIGGTYSSNLYLSEKSHGRHGGRIFDWFYFVESINDVNQQWEKMWKTVLPHLPIANVWKYVTRLNRLLPRYEAHEVPDNHVYPDLKTWQEHLRNPCYGKIRKYNEGLKDVLNNAKPNIFFNNKEIKDGQIVVENLGIPANKQYICFHARDSEYLNAVGKTIDWSYHNYRDSSILNYLSAAEEMANRGYYAVRMGAKVKDRITSVHPRVIDYATNGNRSDFNDIYIGSHCRFFFCSDGGMSAIPEMFRIPCVYVNWTSRLGY